MSRVATATDQRGPGTNQFIVADFGGVFTVSEVLVAPIDSAFQGWGAHYTNGVSIETSTDGATWALANTIANTEVGVTKSFPVNTRARYVRLTKTATAYIGLGELWFR